MITLKKIALNIALLGFLLGGGQVVGGGPQY